uniref:C-type lectin domain-containing protein n=1 Tax=Rhabditophanes sp. KR3021 TaxID=114890 RepID=A0AC35TJV0_9BILA
MIKIRKIWIEFQSNTWIDLFPQMVNGMTGQVSRKRNAVHPGYPYYSPIKASFCKDFSNTCGMASYRDPCFWDYYQYPCHLLRGASVLAQNLKDYQFYEQIPQLNNDNYLYYQQRDQDAFSMYASKNSYQNDENPFFSNKLPFINTNLFAYSNNVCYHYQGPKNGRRTHHHNSLYSKVATPYTRKPLNKEHL